jgi:hypothetical protein
MDDGACCVNGDTTIHTSTAVVVVFITDVNDNKPVFKDCGTYYPKVEEGAPNGSPVIKVCVSVMQSIHPLSELWITATSMHSIHSFKIFFFFFPKPLFQFVSMLFLSAFSLFTVYKCSSQFLTGFFEYMYNHPSVLVILVICAQTPDGMFISFFVKSAVMAPFSCGPTAFLKLNSLNKGLHLIHVINVLCDRFVI